MGNHFLMAHTLSSCYQHTNNYQRITTRYYCVGYCLCTYGDDRIVSLDLPLDHRSMRGAITPVVGRQPIQNQYDPLNYKCTGSVVMWTLANKLTDAFVVWMLAQKYDRSKQVSRKPTGHISSPHFVAWLTKTMNVEPRTTYSRLEKALKHGFLLQTDRGYKITSHRKMIQVAMSDQARRHEENKGLDPSVYLSADREYTRQLSKWIDPRDLDVTAALLSGRAMQQGSILARGRKSQGNIVKCSERTMIRRTEKADVVELGRYILIDPLKILVDADCTLRDAIEAFMMAEKKYREHSHLSTCKLLHSKFIHHLKRSLLAIQIGNVYFSHSDVKEVPANRRCHQSPRKSRRVPSAAYASDSPVPATQDSYTTWWSGRYVGSKDQGDNHVPSNIMDMVMHQFRLIVEDPECAEIIMARTGATGLRSVAAGQPCGFVERVSGVTPSFDTSATEPTL